MLEFLSFEDEPEPVIVKLPLSPGPMMTSGEVVLTDINGRQTRLGVGGITFGELTNITTNVASNNVAIGYNSPYQRIEPRLLEDYNELDAELQASFYELSGDGPIVRRIRR